MRRLTTIIMGLLCAAQVFAQPDWSAPTFEKNMAVRTSLIDACNSVDDIIGVFSKSSGEIRGVSDPITTTDTFLITVFSETSSGEVVVFKLYDNESDSIFDIAGMEFSFLNGSVLGLEIPIVIPGQESVPPVMMCKNKTVYLDENGEASIVVDDIDDGSTDNCVIASRVLSRHDFSCADLGNQTVTLTITDTYNNSSSCDAIVTVLDTISPTPSCLSPTIYINENGVATLAISDTDDVSFDNCNTLIKELSQTSFDCVEKGSNNVTLTVRDASGNVDSCIALVTVLDTIKPIVNCNSVIVFLDANGATSITTEDIDDNSTDNCTISSVVLDQMDFDCDELGSNMVTLTVTDNSNNIQSCMSTVTVRDTIKPVAVCKPYTLVLDAMGLATLTSDDINNGSTDNCSIETMMLSKTDFDCTDIGMQSVTMTITDKAGNTDMCATTVTIVDDLPPVIVCRNIDVELAADGTATITTADVDNGSTDNCGIATRVISKSTFSKNEDRVQTVTLTITDNVGLVSMCTAQITIINNFENDIINCSDGVDNDNDGMVDCLDPDCGKPILANVSSVDPTPISCTQTQLNGSITIAALGADLYSIDGGSTTMSTGVFPALVGADYNAWVQNTETGCTASEDIVLNNTFDPIWDATGFPIIGPQSLCAGLEEVSYSIDVKESFVDLTWASSSAAVTSTSVGTESKLNFGVIDTGYLVASVQGICVTVKDSIMIYPALSTFCDISNCQNNLFINNEVDDIIGVPDVFRAQEILTTNAQLSGRDREMTAGQEVQFLTGFEVETGMSLIADIKPCGG